MQTDKKKAFSKFLSGSTDECLVQKCRQTADKDAVGCRCLDVSLPLTFFRLKKRGWSHSACLRILSLHQLGQNNHHCYDSFGFSWSLVNSAHCCLALPKVKPGKGHMSQSEQKHLSRRNKAFLCIFSFKSSPTHIKEIQLNIERATCGKKWFTYLFIPREEVEI